MVVCFGVGDKQIDRRANTQRQTSQQTPNSQTDKQEQTTPSSYYLGALLSLIVEALGRQLNVRGKSVECPGAVTQWRGEESRGGERGGERRGDERRGKGRKR